MKVTIEKVTDRHRTRVVSEELGVTAVIDHEDRTVTFGAEQDFFDFGEIDDYALLVKKVVEIASETDSECTITSEEEL